uniref:Uncharacterized protein n=1 Tax=uncultured marine virus TaxID=186617 RepID=A0A0F7L8P7_9VIRU|nr:hypothetical protein [uncultured marine virus]
MTRTNQKIFPAHDTDIPAGYARQEIHNTPCIHCGEIFNNHKMIYHKIMYTDVKGKIIWWHIEPCCVPDDIEETL